MWEALDDVGAEPLTGAVDRTRDDGAETLEERREYLGEVIGSERFEASVTEGSRTASGKGRKGRISAPLPPSARAPLQEATQCALSS